MRYTLKGYQKDAVVDVLANLKKSTRDWKQDGDTSAFSLTATTGAGKTVMAAAVIEALFNGDAENNFEADPGAVVLWFTDDPSLNEQTRFRLMAAADKINSSRLVVIENSFSQEQLDAGKVYFLNAQKLSRNAKLVRGVTQHDTGNPQIQLDNVPPPDDRANTMWDILRNTIEDKNLTLYLVLDEAHRGMNSERERATIVQKLINGTSGAPPTPVVWGISATVERFNEAMKKQQGRNIRPPVVVDPARVQDSGLLKDDIRLDFPTEKGTFNTSLLARATRKLKTITERWQTYCNREGSTDDVVVPLLVVQVPNSPSDQLLLSAVETIRDEWPEIPSDAIANVFGEHSDLELGDFTVRYVHPQMIQDQTHVRVLLAKDAISTGWDCPRAEVFVSFRPASDTTYITQLLGRMVRTPLARRIPGDDLLNSVECVLPEFDSNTATEVAKAMIGQRKEDGDGTGGGEGRRVLIAPVDMGTNPNIPDSVWELFDSLPSQTLPRKVARPIFRYTALAQSLSRDGLRVDAVKEAYNELCKVLDGFSARHSDKLEAAKEDVLQVDGATIVVGVHSGDVEDAGVFHELADDRAIQADYKAAGRLLTPELAKRYADYLADPDDDDSLLDAHITVGALGKIDGVTEALDAEADEMAKAWFDEYRVSIKGLSEERQADYDNIKGMSSQPQRIDIKRPHIRTEETKDSEGNLLETRSNHLMADTTGMFPVANLNNWEIKVVDKEMGRSDFLAWYRNPSRASADALAVAWTGSDGNWRRMCPDFIFFHGDENNVKASIVDPHGIHLSDAIPKLKGLADFVEAYGDTFHRIESIGEVDGKLRVLDMKNQKVRDAVRAADDVEVLYRSVEAENYQ
ncbi:DEAD/DEAH box helicase family protein [Spongiibacter nanhainus]|uniref:DEAD/DEAH box helicase family protein n=1 Tax=Spongiibacter nanhainus TaxID=2794344 RepID=A0A7T4R1R2_9GAMM|nr:DEAD/DEAH box helicase family protein [Spongiibacter nanhainus]QQD18722.1 DEAD/DEAH box helicase family protein [Spongiibacter nanhainus]